MCQIDFFVVTLRMYIDWAFSLSTIKEIKAGPEHVFRGFGGVFIIAKGENTYMTL